jgi:DUF1680 family protein
MQGWPKWVLSMVSRAEPPQPPGLLITAWGPLNVTIPNDLGGGLLIVETNYPFGDTAVIRTFGVTKSFTLSLRIPGWAPDATLLRTLHSASSTTASRDLGPLANGTYHHVTIDVGEGSLTIDFKPRIRVEFGWGLGDTNAAAILRGPLMYALPLEEHYTVYVPRSA